MGLASLLPGVKNVWRAHVAIPLPLIKSGVIIVIIILIITVDVVIVVVVLLLRFMRIIPGCASASCSRHLFSRCPLVDFRLEFSRFCSCSVGLAAVPR